MRRRRRRRVDPTDDWEQLELLCVWEEQREYERIRPLVLFGGPVPERSAEADSARSRPMRGGTDGDRNYPALRDLPLRGP